MYSSEHFIHPRNNLKIHYRCPSKILSVELKDCLSLRASQKKCERTFQLLPKLSKFFYELLSLCITEKMRQILQRSLEKLKTFERSWHTSGLQTFEYDYIFKICIISRIIIHLQAFKKRSMKEKSPSACVKYLLYATSGQRFVWSDSEKSSNPRFRMTITLGVVLIRPWFLLSVFRDISGADADWTWSSGFSRNSSSWERAPKKRLSVLLNSLDSFFVILASISSKTWVI